ncbi:C45 family autoproteolytic acyltransferase/hydrolase [Chloroflexota bacterium]
MKIVKLSGTPYEIGLSHGMQCKPEIQKLTKFVGFGSVRMSLPDMRSGHPKLGYLFQAIIKYRNIKDELLRLSHIYEGYMQQYWPALLEEMRGIAEGAAVAYEKILLANVLGEIVNSCSIWAACGAATKNGETLLGMNSDEEKETAKYEIVKIIEPEKGYKVIANSLAGMVWLSSGLNEKGLAMGFPMLWLRRGSKPRQQMPAAVLFKTLFECGTVDEALAMCDGLPEPALPTAQYIVDPHKVARVEWAKDERDVTVIESGFLSNTNLPESAKIKKYDATSEWSDRVTYNAPYRHKRMKQLERQYYGDIDVRVMQAISTDHGEGDTLNKSICQHSLTPMGGATVSALIAQPGKLKVWISGYPPCKTGFMEFEI